MCRRGCGKPLSAAAVYARSSSSLSAGSHTDELRERPLNDDDAGRHDVSLSDTATASPAVAAAAAAAVGGDDTVLLLSLSPMSGGLLHLLLRVQTQSLK